MRILVAGIENPLMWRFNADIDAREHYRAAVRRNQDQGFFRCGLPLRKFSLGFGQLHDVTSGIRHKAGGRGATE
jgi:hypothetical protein